MAIESAAVDPDKMEGMICPNISPAERQRRLSLGIVALVVGLVALAALLMFDVSWWWRVVLFAPFFFAASGYFQWRDKTCVGLAHLKSRQLGDKIERIEDAAELAAVKVQARRVQFKAVVASLVMTLLALLLPTIG